MLRAGVAKLDITPPVGVRLAGYDERVFPSLAVHDPLWARAIVFDNGATRVGLVAIDTLGISAEAVAMVRQGAAAFGIVPEALLVSATHTHSGPVFWADDSLATDEREYWAALPERLVAVLKEASRALSPVRVGAASGWSAIGINRREKTPGGTIVLGRNHFGPFDPEVGVLRIDHATGEPMACLVNYACHGVCLSGDNYLTSADYPGFAVHAIEERIPGVTGLFMNGACGNVNPREGAMGHGLASGGSFMIAERAGSALAREAARAWHKAVPDDCGRLTYASRTVALPTNRARAISRAEEGVRRAERAIARPTRQWSPYLIWYDVPDPEARRRALQHLRDQDDTPVQCETQAIGIGPATLLAWPGEVFCELGMDAKQRSPFRPTYTIGYANGWIGYVPTPEAFQEGGYEADSAAHLADDAGPQLVEQSLELLNGMKA